jgi:hypothetical protein
MVLGLALTAVLRMGLCKEIQTLANKVFFVNQYHSLLLASHRVVELRCDLCNAN